MPTFDQLSAEQRAIIELVLQRKQSYDRLADMLGMSERRVRELARDALVELAPVSASRVDGEWRGQLADYLLGQQSGPEATATRGHLRRSEPARAWARSLLDSLDGLYQDGVPTVPEGERGAVRERRRRREPLRAERPEPRRRVAAKPAEAFRRRRFALAAGAGGLALLFAVLVWPIGVLGGDDDGGGERASGGGGAQSRPNIVGQTVLRGVEGARGAGIAVVTERRGRRQVVVQARLTANKDREAYEVWLYNSDQDARSIGAQVTDRQGNYLGAGPLPSNYSKYRFIDVSREPIDQNRGHSGQSVLRGELRTRGG